jgi:hypothetical protein
MPRLQTEGYWRLPTYGEEQDISCIPPVARDALHVDDLEKFVVVAGVGYRTVGLSWEFVPPSQNLTHPYGYLDIAVRTRQDEVCTTWNVDVACCTAVLCQMSTGLCVHKVQYWPARVRACVRTSFRTVLKDHPS